MAILPKTTYAETESLFIHLKVKAARKHARNPTQRPIQPKQLERGEIWGYLRKRNQKTMSKHRKTNLKTYPEKIEHMDKENKRKNKIMHGAEYTQTQHGQILRG